MSYTKEKVDYLRIKCNNKLKHIRKKSLLSFIKEDPIQVESVIADLNLISKKCEL